jgi:Ca2+/H+ antiporter, TMEM165/GDT1 family
MPAAWSTLLLLLFFAAAVVAVSTEETFRKLDKDNSGTLDLQEYRQLASRLQMSVDAIVGDSKEPPASAAEADMRNQDAVGYGGPGFWGGFVSGVGMIMATEIGDKTFFIAAIMAMQYPRILVFAGAIAALAVMTVLSAALGFALPNVLPRQYTHYLGAVSVITSLIS